jgi:hypothetical protein
VQQDREKEEGAFGFAQVGLLAFDQGSAEGTAYSAEVL